MSGLLIISLGCMYTLEAGEAYGISQVLLEMDSSLVEKA
jgi:hypothetical protein